MAIKCILCKMSAEASFGYADGAKWGKLCIFCENTSLLVLKKNLYF